MSSPTEGYRCATQRVPSPNTDDAIGSEQRRSTHKTMDHFVYAKRLQTDYISFLSDQLTGDPEKWTQRSIEWHIGDLESRARWPMRKTQSGCPNDKPTQSTLTERYR